MEQNGTGKKNFTENERTLNNRKKFGPAYQKIELRVDQSRVNRYFVIE